MMRTSRSPMTWTGNLRELAHSPSLFLWCVFLLLSPLYVVASGLPQPGDWLVLLLTPVALFGWNGRLDRASSRAVKALLLFTLWTCLVNWGWASVLWKWNKLFDYVIHPLFYIFNAAVFLSAIVIAKRDPERFLRVTVDVVFVTIIACAIASTFSATGGRTAVFFNSPNQMGYYALLSACLFAMVQRPLGIGRVKASIGVTSCAYIAFLSASRASLAGILLLLFLLVFSNPKVIIAAALAAVALVTVVPGPIKSSLEFNQKRAVEDRDPNQSFAEERGYDRIWNFPQYVVLGAGEGHNQRFAKPGEHPRELHSSFGSLLFGYGIVGITLFLVFCWRVVQGAPLRMTLLLVPALVYTVAHQGLRFTMFWVVLVAFLMLKNLREPPRDHVPAKT